MTCFTYEEDDVLGFAVDYTSTNVVIYIYLNGTLVETKTLPLTSSSQEIVAAATMGTHTDTDARVQIRTYPQAFKNDIPEGYEPLENPTGYTGFEYLSTGGYISHPDDENPNRPYADAIKEFPNFRRSTDVAFTGQTKQPYGDIVIHNEDGGRDSWLDRSWNGRDLKLYIGDRSWARRDFRELMVGTSHELTSTSLSTLSFRMRDKGIFLEKDIQENKFTAGDSEGQLKPLCYGECYSISPVLEDGATHKYRIHDGAINSIIAVYDKGVSVAFTPDLADGSFTLTAQPAGQITADVTGATFIGYDGGGEGYYNTVGQIIYHILTTKTDVPNSLIDGYNLYTFDIDNTEALGYYTDSATKVSTVLDHLLKHLDGFWGFDRNGRFKLGKLISPNTVTEQGSSLAIENMSDPVESYTTTPVEDHVDSLAIATGFKITSDDIVQGGMRIKSRNLPLYTTTLGYKKYWHPLGPNDVAGSVTEAQIADLKEEFRLAVDERPATLTHHLLAGDSGLIPTCLVSESDALTLASRHRKLFSQTRTTYIVDAFTSPFGVDLGDVIEIDHNRFGFDGGVKCLVVGYSESISPDRIVLEVWK